MALDDDESETESESEVAEDGLTRFGAGFWPWRVCMSFLEYQMGRPVRGCAYGDRCTFAHSRAELHPEASAREHELTWKTEVVAVASGARGEESGWGVGAGKGWGWMR